MSNNKISLGKFSAEKSLIYILISAVLVVLVFVFYLFFSHGVKNIQILSPNGGEEWEVGKSYEITWKAKGIKKIGIVLFNRKEGKWIAKDIDAQSGKYEWKIHFGQDYGDNYWIAVFEYPWQEGNKISYSKAPFIITYSKSISCDSLSAEKEWPYLPSDLPAIRRVFITEQSYTGNLGGLEGADKKCQEEAEKQGFKGKWQAFLGGDKDEETAIERLKKTPRGIEGIFVEAKPSAKLIRGKEVTCHRLLGRSFDEFLAKFSNSVLINQQKFDKEFLSKLSSIWLGRISKKSKKNCLSIYKISSDSYIPLPEKYTFTVTCQNWSQGKAFVENYFRSEEQLNSSFPVCYTPKGALTKAVALGGLAEGLIKENENNERFTPSQGKSCESEQRLLCIEI